MLSKKLVELGMKEEQASQLIDAMGLETEEHFRHITETDLVEVGLKRAPARALLEKLGVKTSNGTSSEGPREITVKLDSGDAPVAKMDDPTDLLLVLSGKRSTADKKAAARRLEGMGRKVVVDKGNRKNLLVEDTATYWQRGSLHAKFWLNNNPVVSAMSLFESDEKVEVDPFELVHSRHFVALIEGQNPESGADWSKVSMPRRALLVLSALQGEVVAKGDSVEIAAVLSAERLTGKWSILETRADAERIEEIQRHLKVPLADVDTPDSVGASAILVAIFGRSSSSPPAGGSSYGGGAPTGGGKSRSVEFREYLMRGFGASGIRGLDWDLRSSLPGDTASLMTTATAFVEVAERHGKVSDPAFWTTIMQANPGRSREARAVAAMYGVTSL